MAFAHRTSALAVCVSLFVVTSALGGDWPCWRGPNYDGISSESGLNLAWSQPPKVLWEAATGSAFSAFSCVGDRVYTCGTKNKMQVLYCMDAKSGAIVWENAFEPERKDGQGGDGTRATPTVDDGRVYILGGHGLLLCVDVQAGKEIWRKQFSHEPHWGYSGSVLIEGPMAITSGGGSDGGLLALDKKTGKEIWRCTEEPTGYSTPYPFTFGGKRYIVGFLAKIALVVEAETGREVWRTTWNTDHDVNAPTPIFSDGYLFLSSGYKTGCAVFRLTPDGDKLTGEKVWGISNVIMSKMQSCVLADGVLYGSDQRRALKCVDLKTGKELWSADGFANATVTLVDGHLLVLTEAGKLVAAKASSTEFKPIAEAAILDGRCWTIPTLSNGRLYARNFKKAVCVDLAAAK